MLIRAGLVSDEQPGKTPLWVDSDRYQLIEILDESIINDTDCYRPIMVLEKGLIGSDKKQALEPPTQEDAKKVFVKNGRELIKINAGGKNRIPTVLQCIMRSP